MWTAMSSSRTIAFRTTDMKAVIYRTCHTSLMEYITDGLKVDDVSADLKEATRNVESIQDLVDIMDQANAEVVVFHGTGRHEGSLMVEIYDDYRE